ncbi:ComEC/Rec2 family competence protein [Marinomonas posidonica]|uniref:ComEC/Rec2-related protein n=1 Tax=Marinomonas posidonica (strain CECT 7376 / NCIMB 14433 / IVIA-Po-181) TaxID=491952 RepID=F6D170_MARPP|nr:ComEC/Rec2 family competence protein [Marinomonas posidonica]AEF54877.1 ComEC/Rec2-related protein [Marinomonas posidonica IVIA-Po-181]
MLLSSLSTLMGAILVPSAYLWLYSTHITFLCLYLIYTKRVLVLFLTIISLFSVINSETEGELAVTLSKDSAYFVGFEDKQVILLTDKALAQVDPIRLASQIRVRFQVPPDQPLSHSRVMEFNDFELSLTTQIPPHYQAVKLVRYALADKEGPWWLKNLYIERQAAQLVFSVQHEWLKQLPLGGRQVVLNQLDERFKSFESWRFSKALLLGADDLWSQRDTWMIRTLGLAHLFVVSGLHTGFMAVIGFVLARLVWWMLPAQLLLAGFTRWQLECALVVPLLVTYGFITDWGEPVVRASIMLSVYLLSRVLMVKLSAFQIIGFTLWLVLFVNPRSVLSPGLWLSFSMVYLLIGFYPLTQWQWRRMISTQVMLSSASMVLILGWQDVISIASIAVNLFMIPFAATVWFPVGMLACLEALLLQTQFVYYVLDWGLIHVIALLEWLVFEWSLLTFDRVTSTLPKLLLLLWLLFWVFQTPLKRGGIALLIIWMSLFSNSLIFEPKADMVLRNHQGKLLLEKGEEQWVNDWLPSSTGLMLDTFLTKNTNTASIMLAPNKLDIFSPLTLLKVNPDWLILANDEDHFNKVILAALSIDWLNIEQSESLSFYFRDDGIRLKHSHCRYSFFLFKSDTCKRAEKLESVLN